MVKCSRCSEEVAPDDVYNYREQALCEDCYMGALQAPKTCDVAATQHAKKHRQAAGQRGTDGLLPLQKEIHDFIRDNGMVTRSQVMEEFAIPEWELEKQVAVLRHCELVKGKKAGDAVYLVLFND